MSMLISNVSSPPCSQLFQANHTVFGSSQGSSTEDLFTDSIDSCDLDITEKVQTHVCKAACTFHILGTRIWVNTGLVHHTV